MNIYESSEKNNINGVNNALYQNELESKNMIEKILLNEKLYGNKTVGHSDSYFEDM